MFGGGAVWGKGAPLRAHAEASLPPEVPVPGRYYGIEFI